MLVRDLRATGFRVGDVREFSDLDSFAAQAHTSTVNLSYLSVVASCAPNIAAVRVLGPNTLTSLVHSQGRMNLFGYADGDLDSLLDRAASAADMETRKRLFWQAEQRILDDAVLVPIYSWPLETK